MNREREREEGGEGSKDRLVSKDYQANWGSDR